MLLVALLTVLAQLVGFYLLIYHFFSWDEMEPYTYLLGKLGVHSLTQALSTRSQAWCFISCTEAI